MIHTDLFIAAEYGRPEPFEDLPLSGYIDFHKDEHENTLLSIAAQKGHKELVRLLIHKGASIYAKNKDDKTPLSYVVGNGDIDVITVMLTCDRFLEAEEWMKVCKVFERHLSDKRLEQFKSKGKSSEITDSLAKDALTLAKLRIILSDQISEAHEYAFGNSRSSMDTDVPTGTQPTLIRSDMTDEINKKVEELDQTVRDLLQIEFAWTTIHEARISTRLGQNVMLLTYVSIFYLPLGFCAALWAIPDITDNGTRTPFIVTATTVSVVTLLVTFNMEKIATIIQRGYQYGGNYIISKWQEMKGRQYPGLL